MSVQSPGSGHKNPATTSSDRSMHLKTDYLSASSTLYISFSSISIYQERRARYLLRRGFLEHISSRRFMMKLSSHLMGTPINSRRQISLHPESESSSLTVATRISYSHLYRTESNRDLARFQTPDCGIGQDRDNIELSRFSTTEASVFMTRWKLASIYA